MGFFVYILHQSKRVASINYKAALLGRKGYMVLTSKNNIFLSMTENSDPYENALAERMNRTIKDELG